MDELFVKYSLLLPAGVIKNQMLYKIDAEEGRMIPDSYIIGKDIKRAGVDNMLIPVLFMSLPYLVRFITS